ncbi:MAG: hypothetical protein JXR70_12945 [Spirochaetales bacterium]|nr:hypothetical protein [Spirochaetales bacterium]
MKISEFLLAVLLGYLVSSMFVIFLGEHGMEAFRVLQEQKQILTSNISHLKETQVSLVEKLSRLKEGTELVKTLSRELGYYDSLQDEEIFVIQGYEADARAYNPGKIVFFKNKNTKSDLFFRILGFLVGFMVYTIILVCIRIADNGNQQKQPRLVSQNDRMLNREQSGHPAM